MEDKNRPDLSRKSFIKKIGAASAALSGIPLLGKSASKNQQILSPKLYDERKVSANDKINFAIIGAGGMGQGNVNTALNHSGVKLVASCDLYDSRLERCRELYGRQIFTTTNYKEILDRPDIDAVIIATPDHWHMQQAIDALEAGKAVYLEKPMVQHVEQGIELIDAERRTGRPLLVGSQRTSSIIYEKARDLLQDGEIGNLNFVEAYWDRFSAIGAWQYSIPPGAGEHNIDWEEYRRGMEQIPFNAKHFFRWRNYDDYGTGVAGDLFVHLFSGLHLIADASGPDSIMATGGLRYWHDGRDAEDVMLGLFNYPETDKHPNFTLSLRVNFADGSGGGSRIRLVGDEGEMVLGGNYVTLRKSKLPERPGHTIDDFSEDTREEYLEYYEQKYPESRAQIIEPDEFVYRTPDGYNDRYDHFGYFFDAIRNGTDLLQDSSFGLRASGPALLANVSHRERKIVNWNSETMETI